MLYILGKALDMEAALEGFLGAKTTKGVYFKAMGKRFVRALKGLKAIDKALGGTAEVKAMISSLGKKLNPKDKSTIEAAHTRLHNTIMTFLETADGSKLVAIDALIPTKTKGTAK